ncbi:MAG: hypothetical protein A2Y78_00830 [Acidobacteria bacterium RBG_13_68_16]|nr:MAG: hypothetical protein A2Y78_00830 [Acidobacteria bacterium RBG_13_68_16]
MSAAAALWILVPLALVHILARRNRTLLLFQIAVDVGLVLLPGRILLRGLHVGPGVPGASGWGAPVAVTGSTEQSDLPLEFSAWWEEVRRLVAQGEPPWISERIGGGVPLYANGQTEVPFPLQLPVWVLGAEGGSDVMAVWKLELAALGGFLLLRRLGTVPVAAATGALAFGFGLYQLSWLVVPLTWVVALAPWSWWALLGALRGNRRQAALLAVLLGALAGWSVHAETAGFLWLSIGAGGLVLAWGRRRRLLRLAAPLLLALPVAAVGAIPTLATIADSSKLAAGTSRVAYPDPGLDWSQKARAAALVLVPWREGHPAAGTWRLQFPHAAVAVGVGAVAVALALGAPVRRRHRRAALALAVSGALAAALLYQLPGFSQLAARVPGLGVMNWARAGFLVGLTVACLAALGLDAWLRRPTRRRLAGVALATQAAVAALALSAPGTPGTGPRLTLVLPSVLAAVAAAPAVAPVTVPILVGLETVANGWHVLPGSRPASPTPPILRELQVRVAEEGGRVVATGAALPANLAARLGLADVRSMDPVRPRALARLHEAMGAAGGDLPGPVTTPWPGLAGAWGVRWLATPPEGFIGPAATGWQEIFRSDAGRLYRNPRALAALRLATKVAPPLGDASGGGWEGVDFATTAVVAEQVSVGGEGTLTPVEDRPWRHVARVRATGPVLAVLHVPRAPGWRTFLDGREVRAVLCDLAAMGVVIPDGEHEVRWQYAPPGLAPGSVLSLAGLAGCLVLSLSSPRRRR